MAKDINFIEIKRAGDEVMIAFHPRDGQEPQWRWIEAKEAMALSLLLTNEAPSSVVNFDADVFALQVLNHPYRCAWLMMSGVRGGQSRRLTALIKDDTITRVGLTLRSLSSAILFGKSGRQHSYRYKVPYFRVSRQAISAAPA